MIFSLEALRARHGDALLLHFGSTDAPRAVLIDGGPGGVWDDALRPRLLELRDRLRALGRLGDDDPLLLELVMVSHIDDDHIGGLLGLTGELLANPQQRPWLRAKALWHNSFQELTGDDGTAVEMSGDLEHDDTAAAVIASVAQGNALRAQAEQLGWGINAPFGALVTAPEQGGARVALDGATTLRVIAPREAQIEPLRREWAEQMRRLARKQQTPAQVAAYLDSSPYNLSSIVCLAEHDGRRMLLTGDARGDHVLSALDAAGLTDAGAIHVDILKLPHHGSIRNIDRDFFERITADHYVISANGRFGNPESETLEMIAGSRSDDDFTVHLTYAGGAGDLAARLAKFDRELRENQRTCTVRTRDDAALSMTIDLGDPPPA